MHMRNGEFAEKLSMKDFVLKEYTHGNFWCVQASETDSIHGILTYESMNLMENRCFMILVMCGFA